MKMRYFLSLSYKCYGFYSNWRQETKHSNTIGKKKNQLTTETIAISLKFSLNKVTTTNIERLDHQADTSLEIDWNVSCAGNACVA